MERPYFCMGMNDLASLTGKFIQQNQLLSEGDPVLVAISGGPDSVALAHVLRHLGFNITFAHCNFQLRPEADEEEAFLFQLSREWNVPIFVQRFDTRQEADLQGESIQLAARRLRYSWLEKIMKENGFRNCTTAHHLGDHAETILLNLLRSHHPQVLRGIPLRREGFIRPFLKFTKQQIYQYLKDHHLLWKEDASNREEKYLRNFLRQNILPPALIINPSLLTHLEGRLNQYELQTGFIASVLHRGEARWIERLDGKTNLLLNAFADEFGKEFLPLLLDHAFSRMEIPGVLASEVRKLLSSSSGKKFLFPGGEIIRERDHLSIIYPAGDRYAGEVWISEMKEGKTEAILGKRSVALEILETQTGSFKGEPGDFLMDAEKIEWPLCLRRWKEGDRMQPLGMEGSRKLSDIFIDRKFTHWQKKQAIVFEDRRQILCLSEFRIAAAAKITAETRSVLKISTDRP